MADAKTTIQAISRLLTPVHSLGYPLKDIQQLNAFEGQYITDDVLALEVADKAEMLKQTYAEHSTDDVFTLMAWLMVSTDIHQGYINKHNTRDDYHHKLVSDGVNPQAIAQKITLEIEKAKPSIAKGFISKTNSDNGKKSRGVSKPNRRSPMKNLVQKIFKDNPTTLRVWNERQATQLLGENGVTVISNTDGKCELTAIIDGENINTTIEGSTFKDYYLKRNTNKVAKRA